LERALAAQYDSDDWLPGSLRERILAVIERLSGRATAGRARTIGELEHSWAAVPLGLKPEEPVRALAAALDRLGGNHTPYPTVIENGRLTSLPPAVDPGQIGASIQLVQHTRGAEAARALYREYAERFDGHPRILIYEGELELWLGNYERAAQIFREVLARRNDMKWAWIGLGASAMLQGELDEAQRTWKEGLAVTRAGPTLYVYRGECFRRQGRADAARRDLELAVRQKPQRLSAWINLALLDQRDDVLQQVERKLIESAPLLMAELSGTLTDKLEKVLDSMRGNRSSTRVTYHLWNKVWHFGLGGS
jgi:tetratricopeptide (TPR) repeat protein